MFGLTSSTDTTPDPDTGFDPQIFTHPDDRGPIAKTARLIGKEPDLCHPTPTPEPVVSGSDGRKRGTDIDTSILRIVPYSGEEGEDEAVIKGVEMLRSLHETHSGTTTTFEAWFQGGEIRFFAYTDGDADQLRQSIQSNYPNADVSSIHDNLIFPAIKSDDCVAGANVREEDYLDYLPIRRYDDDEWEHGDPYRDILGDMLSSDDTRVVVQTVMEPVPKTWTDQSHSNDISAQDKIDDLKSMTEVGWFPPKMVEPTNTELRRADSIETQIRTRAFSTNIRVLAISPDPQEAAKTAQDISSAFGTYYSTNAYQGLEADPITGRTDTMLNVEMKRHINRMVAREHNPDRADIFSFKEAGGFVHLPDGSIPVQQIDRNRTKTGGEIPTDANTAV